MVVKNFKNDEISAYQGYSSDVISNQENFDSYIFEKSWFSFLFHFESNPDWGNLVVDFGGRIGENTRLIKNVVVVEIDKKARDWMKKNNIKCVPSLNHFKDNSVDTIYMSHVLEHLERPIDYLRLAYKKLKKGGRIIIVVPAEFQLPEPTSPLIDLNGHLHGYTFRHLMTSLDRVGFKSTFWRYNVVIFKSIIKDNLPLHFKDFIYRCSASYLKFLRWVNNSYILRTALFVVHYYLKPLLHIIGKLSNDTLIFNLETYIIAKK